MVACWRAASIFLPVPGVHGLIWIWMSSGSSLLVFLQFCAAASGGTNGTAGIAATRGLGSTVVHTHALHPRLRTLRKLSISL